MLAASSAVIGEPKPVVLGCKGERPNLLVTCCGMSGVWPGLRKPQVTGGGTEQGVATRLSILSTKILTGCCGLAVAGVATLIPVIDGIGSS